MKITKPKIFNIKLPAYVFFLLIFSTCCERVVNKSDESYSIVKSKLDLKQIEKFDTVLIKGCLKKWMPWSKGKGGGNQYLKYEILFSDSTKLPVINNIDIDSSYINKHVNVKGIVIYRSMHDEPCPPYCQNTGAFWQLKSIIEIQIDH